MIIANRKRTTCFFCFMFVAVACLATPGLYGDTPSLRRAQEMLQDLEQARLRAAKNRFERPDFTQSYVNERLNTIQAVVIAALTSMLTSAPRPSCQVLQADLRSALGYRGEPDSNVASVICRVVENRTYYVVAYDLTVGPTHSRSWVGVFGPLPQGSEYILLASAGDALPNKTVALALLPEGPHEELRFLAYGINWGDPHSRLTAIAYSLDGRVLKLIWSRADLPGGTLSVEDGRITLRFLNMALGPGFRGVREVTEVYRVTPSGVMLASTSMGPSSVGVKPPVHTKKFSSIKRAP